jgi:putative aldouronate transport system permease protein
MEPSRIAFNIIAYTLLGLAAIVSFVPFIMVVSGSLSSNSAIIKNGYSIFPQGITLDAYRLIFIFPAVIGRTYLISITITICGTLGGITIMSMAGYALQRRELKYANAIAFFFYFTTLFNCGLVPWYMLISSLGMRNTLWALILPMMISSFSILLVRNFMRQLPASLIESAKIDGAGEFRIFLTIVLPLSKPILATISLFLGLSYWNDWYHASLFIKDVNLWPLQFKLYQILTAQIAMATAGTETFSNRVIPTEAVKLANAVIATGPIVLLYPFLQKYFVQGITIGAVKG